MAKESGLGDRLFVSGYDLSGDSNDVQITANTATLDMTGLPDGATARDGGIRDSTISWKSYWNTTGAHPVLSALPTSNIYVTYCRSTLLGAPAFAHRAVQIGYDPKRGNDGALAMDVETVGAQYAGDWGVQLTAGARTDTAATNGASVHDAGAATAFGAQAYLQLIGCTATATTKIVIQDSPDNATWNDLVEFTPVVTGSAPLGERVTVTGNVDEYVRVITTTTGAITSVQFEVMIVRNEFAVTP